MESGSGRTVDYQKLFLQHLALIDHIVHHISRRQRLPEGAGEEFASVVRLKFIERDFAILRKFQGRSALATYLTTVIERLYLDFCITQWGKWRPSAAARRMGPVATHLEQLVSRDGLTFDEAVGTLQINHGVTETRDELHAMLQQLPVRTTRRSGGEDELAIVASRTGADDPAFDHSDDRDAVERIEAALAGAVAKLPIQDQLILKMRFHDDLAVAQMARLLAMEAKPLYRRLEQIAEVLRKDLHREGIDQTAIDRIVGHPALTLGGVLTPAGSGIPENDGLRPSNA